MDTSKFITPELQKAAANYIQMLSSYTEKGVNAAAKEVPAIIQEYLKLIFIEHAFWAVASLLLILAVIIVVSFIWYSSRTWRDDESRQLARGVSTVLSLFPLSFGSFAIIEHGLICAQIYWAPKAFLIKHVIETFK